ncbi:hypothetical protein, partial [Sinorhizobium meliloti]|uniref:hypothetical protein n=1 Tax=Rhizobium meliloti TaxID=382 RepID=UPI001AECB09F
VKFSLFRSSIRKFYPRQPLQVRLWSRFSGEIGASATRFQPLPQIPSRGDQVGQNPRPRKMVRKRRPLVSAKLLNV